MDLLPTSEQQQIIASAAEFLADKLPVERLHGRDGSPARTSNELWREIADLGWFGLAVDESAGGVGYGAVEEALLFEQLGRVLAPPQILFTVVAAHVAAAAGASALAASLMSGELRAALAVNDEFGGNEAFARRRLYGVEDASVAVAIDGDTAAVLDLKGCDFPASPCLDSSVSLAVADLSGRPVLARTESAGVAQRGALLTAALQVGLAQTTVEMLAEYAKIRHTFGRPIGAYQAVRHPAAEMVARKEAAKAQLYLAAVMTAYGRDEAPLQVSAARVLAERAAMLNADDNIQLHGGIGVTEEFTAHFFIKRANLLAQWFGDRRAHLNHIVERTLATVGAAQ